MRLKLLFLSSVLVYVHGQSNCDHPSRFTCNDDTCIPLARKCDGNPDCLDGEDELECIDMTQCAACATCTVRGVYSELGYRCRSYCTPRVTWCRGSNKICMCDEECGYSCVNPKSLCPTEVPPVPNSYRHEIIRFENNKRVIVPRSEDPKYGDLVRYKCKRGTRLVGPLPRCNGWRLWTEEIPRCVDATCRGPFPRANGAIMKYATRKGRRISNTDLPIYGDKVKYICPPDLLLIGNEAPTCTKDRTWSLDRQQCIVPCQDRDLESAFLMGIGCGPICLTSADCTENMICLCDLACGRVCVYKNITCGPPPTIQLANVTYSGFGVGQLVRYTCKEGYYMKGGRVLLQCSGSGLWVGELSTCRMAECGSPRRSITSTFGEVRTTNRNWYGSVATFSCPSNYKMLGSKTRVCMENGKWSGLLTVCDLKDDVDRCPNPGVPINGRKIDRDFSIGATVRYRCDEGYALVGDAEITCIYFKQWSNDAPLCVDPSYRSSKSDIVRTLSKSLSNLPDQSLTIDRSISASDTNVGHEIYFVFDVSDSITKKYEDFKSGIEFSKRLIQRLKYFGGELKYSIIAYASSNLTTLNIESEESTSTTHVIKALDNLNKQVKGRAGKLLNETRTGTATAKALRSLQETISIMKMKYPKDKRHVFLFTDGMHNEGEDPVDVRIDMEKEFYPNIEFYSITSQESLKSDAYEEMVGLASSTENFIFIDDLHLLSSYLDKVTDVKADFSKCGQAGNVGKHIKEMALKRVVGGEQAVENAWPWQALITKIASNINLIYSIEENQMGGGSLINDRWVLTAAHLFDRLKDPKNSKWHESVLVHLGISIKPTSEQDMIRSIQMYIPGEIIIHSEYDKKTNNNDLALIRLGKAYHRNMTETPVERISYTFYIKPICLPCTDSCLKESQLTDDNGKSLIKPGEDRCATEEKILLQKDAKMVATGFGDTEQSNRPNKRMPKNLSTELKQALLKIQDDERCEDAIPIINKKLRMPMRYHETSFCCLSASDESADTCQGDSGGPVVREVLNLTSGESCWVQIGLVSWGYGCGAVVEGEAIPGFYVNIIKYISWIKDKISG